MEEEDKPVEVVEVKKEEPPKPPEPHDDKPSWAKALEDRLDSLAEEVKKLAPAPVEGNGGEGGDDFPKPGHTIQDESPANKKPWTHRSVFH
jgi:hypothetical protein